MKKKNIIQIYIPTRKELYDTLKVMEKSKPNECVEDAVFYLKNQRKLGAKERFTISMVALYLREICQVALYLREICQTAKNMSTAETKRSKRENLAKTT